jgi:hypothetical protein
MDTRLRRALCLAAVLPFGLSDAADAASYPALEQILERLEQLERRQEAQ